MSLSTWCAQVSKLKERKAVACGGVFPDEFMICTISLMYVCT